MKPIAVVLCTSGGLFGALVLRRLLAAKHIDVTGIVLSSRVLRARYSWGRGAWEQIRLSGLRYALYLWTATGLADLLGRWLSGCSVECLAMAHAIPLHVTRNINDAAGCEFIASRIPDILVSAFFNQRLTESTYRIPARGAINIHPSLLPRFRGVDPVFFARLRQSAPLGVSVHRVDATLDTGAILAQAQHVPRGTDSVLLTTAELYALGAGLVTENIHEFLQQESGQPQAGAGTYDSWPRPADVVAFRRGGGHLVSRRDFRALVKGELGEGPPR